LHWAAANGQLSVVEFLLVNGADIEAKEDQSSRGTALHLAVNAGNKAMVELLSDKKANVNATSSGAMTPLHLAAQKGFRSIVELLLARGAKPDPRSDQGATPLHLAVANGFKSTAEALLEHGADPNLSCSSFYKGSLPGVALAGTALNLATVLGA